MNEWICDCGAKNTAKFCKNCGKPKPGEKKSSIEQENNVSMKKNRKIGILYGPSQGTINEKNEISGDVKIAPAPKEWTCSCGRKNTKNFCKSCGKPNPSIKTALAEKDFVEKTKTESALLPQPMNEKSCKNQILPNPHTFELSSMKNDTRACW